MFKLSLCQRVHTSNPDASREAEANVGSNQRAPISSNTVPGIRVRAPKEHSGSPLDEERASAGPAAQAGHISRGAYHEAC